MRLAIVLTTVLSTLLLGSAISLAAEESQTVEVGGLSIKVPAKFEKQEPKSRIIQYEFSAPKPEGAAADGRMTVMVAGGSVEANIQRWIGQFQNPTGPDGKKAPETVKKEQDGVTIHMVDLNGTYFDSAGGPFAPKVNRENYRMLGAILVTGDTQVFLKFYGPQETMKKYAEDFSSILKSVKK